MRLTDIGYAVGVPAYMLYCLIRFGILFEILLFLCLGWAVIGLLALWATSASTEDDDKTDNCNFKQSAGYRFRSTLHVRTHLGQKN